MQNNDTLDNQQSSSVDQNIGSRIMQNRSVTLVVDDNLTNEAGQAVIDPNISNQRTNQISRTSTLPAYVTQLLTTGVISMIGASVGLTGNLIACEESQKKAECREMGVALSLGSALAFFSVSAFMILARHATRSSASVHPAPSGDLPPPDLNLLDPRRASLDGVDAPSNVQENAGRDEVRSPSSPRAPTAITIESRPNVYRV